MNSPPGEPACPRCGAPHDPGQEYCLECGYRLLPASGVVGRLGAAWQRRFGWYPGDWVWRVLLGFVIAVAGATGRVGRHVVAVLEAQGHDVVAMSRSTGVDVVTGDGLAEALAGVEAVVDAATGPSPEQEAATVNTLPVMV